MKQGASLQRIWQIIIRLKHLYGGWKAIGGKERVDEK